MLDIATKPVKIMPTNATPNASEFGQLLCADTPETSTSPLSEMTAEVAGMPCANVFQEQLHTAEALAFDLKKILVTSRDALNREGVVEQIEVLERWMESYRKGLKAASKIAELGPNWLNDTRDRLRLALDELQRLESESPNTQTNDHARLSEELTTACRRIERVAREIDGLNPSDTATSESQQVPHAA